MAEITLKEQIRKELPKLLRDDPEFRAYVLDISRGSFADRSETESRFDRILNELQRDREEQRRKWDEQNHKWWEHNKEQNRKWEANQQELQRLHEEIMAVAKKQEQGIGALGARWGLQTEQSFRDGLAAILEDSFGVDVHHINEYDDQGIVFGRPDQVELDVIIKNGVLILCEIKSSIDKAGMYIFSRKGDYYEQRHHRKPDRLIVISPWIDNRAQKVADSLGIETYGYSTDVKEL